VIVSDCEGRVFLHFTRAREINNSEILQQYNIV